VGRSSVEASVTRTIQTAAFRALSASMLNPRFKRCPRTMQAHGGIPCRDAFPTRIISNCLFLNDARPQHLRIFGLERCHLSLRARARTRILRLLHWELIGVFQRNLEPQGRVSAEMIDESVSQNLIKPGDAPFGILQAVRPLHSARISRLQQIFGERPISQTFSEVCKKSRPMFGESCKHFGRSEVVLLLTCRLTARFLIRNHFSPGDLIHQS